MTGIYKITNKLNGKSYIGQSIHCGRRLDEHCTGNQFIDQTIQVEGIQNFNFEILKEVKKEELSYWEDYYIIKYNTMFPDGYNKKWNCSQEIRETIIQSLKGNSIKQKQENNYKYKKLKENNTIKQKKENKLLNEKNIIKQKEIKKWEDETLTKAELDIISFYNDTFKNKYRNEENFIDSVEKYKKYKYLNRKNSMKRKKINIHFLNFRADKYFTEAEYRFFIEFIEILKDYNEGKSLWGIGIDGKCLSKDLIFMLQGNGLYEEWRYNSEEFSYKYDRDKVILKISDKKSKNKFADMIGQLLRRKDFNSSNFHYFYEDKEISYEEANKKRFRNIIIEIRANS